MKRADVLERRGQYVCILAILWAIASSNVFGFEGGASKPWLRGDAIIIIDPYDGNDPSINWKKAASDQHLKAVIHRASIGMKVDKMFITTVETVSKYGLKVGAYHLGLRGDPIAQADLFLSQVKRANVAFLALDIEDIGGNNMPLADAERFVRYVYEKTGRYPALYGSLSVVRAISQNYSGDSVFAKAPLWIVSANESLPSIPTTVWSHITLWQFSSELNCPPIVRAKHKDSLCDPYRPYAVPGTRYDLDIDIFLDRPSLFGKLFSSLPGG